MHHLLNKFSQIRIFVHRRGRTEQRGHAFSGAVDFVSQYFDHQLVDSLAAVSRDVLQQFYGEARPVD